MESGIDGWRCVAAKFTKKRRNREKQQHTLKCQKSAKYLPKLDDGILQTEISPQRTAVPHIKLKTNLSSRTSEISSKSDVNYRPFMSVTSFGQTIDLSDIETHELAIYYISHCVADDVSHSSNFFAELFSRARPPKKKMRTRTQSARESKHWRTFYYSASLHLFRDDDFFVCAFVHTIFFHIRYIFGGLLCARLEASEFVGLLALWPLPCVI